MQLCAQLRFARGKRLLSGLGVAVLAAVDARGLLWTLVSAREVQWNGLQFNLGERLA